jgi:hypothetical protein
MATAMGEGPCRVFVCVSDLFTHLLIRLQVKRGDTALGDRPAHIPHEEQRNTSTRKMGALGPRILRRPRILLGHKKERQEPSAGGKHFKY